MLPGCVLAGIGLGVTNTPVTNTTTGSVPAERSGMASGIDMSARMLSLAINIPIMGFLLIEGTRTSISSHAPPHTDAELLRSLAEKIASGTLELAVTNLSEAVVHQALADGFGLIMLYGGISVWLLAALSFVAFGRRASEDTRY
jgi:hypothetical protein